MSVAYNDAINPEVRMFVRRIMALAFLPQIEVIPAYQRITINPPAVAGINAFLDYFHGKI